MKKKAAFFLGVLGILLVLVSNLPLIAAENEVYVYNYEGKTNVTRSGKISELTFDMPMKNGDLFKIEPDSSIDFAFYKAAGLRVTGPSDVRVKSITSIDDMRMHVTGGNMLLHTENPGESFLIAIETPHATISTFEPTLAAILVDPPDKSGKGGHTQVIIKKGRADVRVKASDASIRVLENQKVDVTPETYIPPASGAFGEDLKPAERARTVYVPKEEES